MKKDLYRFLGSFLTAVILITGLGPVGAVAAPQTEDIDLIEDMEPDGDPVPDVPMFTASVDNITTTSARLNVTATGISEENAVTVGVLLTDDMSVSFAVDVASETLVGNYEYDGQLFSFNKSGTQTMTLGGLKNGTKYQYRLFRVEGEPASGYPFATDVAIFTTTTPAVESHVTIGDVVSVEEYGFEAERISFTINNPDNETIRSVEIVDESGRKIGEAVKSTEESAYEAVFPTFAKDPAIRVSVATGGGKAITHALSGDEIKIQDKTNRVITLSGSGSYATLTANAKLDPCYDIDRYTARLNYKKNTDTVYSSKDVSLLSVNGGEGVVSVSGLEADTDYQYYITVFSDYDESRIVESYGSEAEPLTYHTAKAFSLLSDSAYNWKLDSFEFVFGNDLHKGTNVKAEIVSYDEELKDYTVVATASASIGKTAPVSMMFCKNDGKKYRANDGDDVNLRFYIEDESVTPDPLQMKVHYFDELTSVQTGQENAPYTLSFYRIGNPGTPINTFSVGAGMIKDGSYFFIDDDVEPLDPDYIYTCVVLDSNGQISNSVSGYFSYDPEHYRDKAKSVPLKSLKIKGATAMEVGETQRLLVEFTPQDVTDKSVSWSSSDPEVASIGSDGTVSANKGGYTTITLKSSDGKKSDSIVLCVIDKNKDLYVEMPEDERYVYTGEKICPVVAVYNHGKKLIDGLDYKVSYSNNINASTEAKVTVTGVTITGKVVKTFTIHPRSMDDDEIKVAEIVVQSGKATNPMLFLGNYKLTAKDFTFDKKKKFTENGTLLLCGKGNFKGSRKVAVTVGTPKSLKVKSFNPINRTYNGEDQYLSDKELTVADLRSGAILKENEDYILSYQPDVCSSGTVKFTIIGIGAYNNTIKKTYKIQCLKANKNDLEINISDQPYKIGEVIPDVEVTYKGKKLIANQDYKVSVSKNKEVGKAEAKVSFIGNYKGTSKITKEFKITPVPLDGDNVNIFCADMAWTKEAKKLSTPIVTLDGAELNKTNYTPTYSINGNDITTRKVTEADFGGNSSVTVTVTLEAKGKNVTGKAECTYRIFKADVDNDLSKAKVEIKTSAGKSVSSIPYNGHPIEIKGDYRLVVTLNNKVLTEGKDYSVDYANNIYKGRATVIVTGLGDNSKEETRYYGSKDKYFTITKGTFACF